MDDQALELKRRYEDFAKTLDDKTTACDFNLRELEFAATMYLLERSRCLPTHSGSLVGPPLFRRGGHLLAGRG